MLDGGRKLSKNSFYGLKREGGEGEARETEKKDKPLKGGHRKTGGLTEEYKL